jgi:hypothetical protein
VASAATAGGDNRLFLPRIYAFWRENGDGVVDLAPLPKKFHFRPLPLPGGSKLGEVYFFFERKDFHTFRTGSLIVLVTKIIDKIRNRHQPEITNTTTFSKAG